MVYVIKDTVHIYCFCQRCYETAQEHLLLKLPPVSLKQIEKFLHFSFKTVEIFSYSKPRAPGQRKLGESPTPGAVRTCESPGGRRRGWSGLELTDTLFPIYKGKVCDTWFIITAASTRSYILLIILRSLPCSPF